VLLGRLRIRGKLILLVLIPLLAMVGLTVPLVVGRIADAGRASEIADSVEVASRVGSLVQDLQRERLLSVGVLLGAADKSRLILQTTAVNDRLTDIRQDLGDSLPADTVNAMARVDELSTVRGQVLAGTAKPVDVSVQFGAVTLQLLQSLRLSSQVDATTPAGKQVVALDTLLRVDEETSSSTTLLLVMVGAKSTQLASQYTSATAAVDTDSGTFSRFATTAQVSLYGLVTEALTTRLGINFDVDFGLNPDQAIASLRVDTLFPALDSFSVLGDFTEKRIASDVLDSVNAQRSRALGTAYGVSALSLLILLLVLGLVAAVARAVARPLTRLTQSADQVALAGETELTRVADDERETAQPVHLDPLDVSARDEIGDLARAFERVQGTATRLVARQVASRRNVAEMFGHIGRRTQNLVGRQVALIDKLERDEAEPDRLQELYRLDHLSNRLRRNASSLVVLSGTDRADEHVEPVRLADLVRLALAEIEDYTRVQVEVPAEVYVVPALVSDLALILAELMENATSFSPPHTTVTVSAAPAPDGRSIWLSVVDHGIGLAPEQLDEENSRLARRERLDLAPTQVLGLFVVGRLARRHGLAVGLAPTEGGGVTATLALGAPALAGHTLAGQALPAPVRASGTAPGRAPLLPAGFDPAQAGTMPGSGMPGPGMPGPGMSGPEPVPPAEVIPAGGRPRQRIPRELVTPLAFDFGALHRASRVLDGEPSWNAFAVSDQAAIEPPRDTQPPAETPASASAARAAATPQPNVPHPNVPHPNVVQPNVAQPNVPQPNVPGSNVAPPDVVRPDVAQSWTAQGWSAQPRSWAAPDESGVAAEQPPTRYPDLWGPTTPMPQVTPGTAAATGTPGDSTSEQTQRFAAAAGTPTDASATAPAQADQAPPAPDSPGPDRSAPDSPGQGTEPPRPFGAKPFGATGPSGLRQRIPGGQLPTNGTPQRMPVNSTPPGDEDTVRHLLESFEDGVRRAETERLDAGTPPEPAAGSGGNSLNRRVPGAALADLNRPGPGDRGGVASGWGANAGEPDEDPAMVRDLVEQFESGVARALQDVRSDHRYEEGASD
jgi:signal transduction histidine kinase